MKNFTFADFPNTRLPIVSIERIPNGCWVRVVGTFRYVDMTMQTRPDGVRVMGMGFGWMNSYDRAITRITDFVVLIALHPTNR
jgi:hypothetical protein